MSDLLDPQRNHGSLKRRTCHGLMVLAALLLIPCSLLRLGYAQGTPASDANGAFPEQRAAEKEAPAAAKELPAEKKAAPASFTIRIHALAAESAAPVANMSVEAKTFVNKNRKRATLPCKTDSQGDAAIEIANFSELGDLSICARPAGYVPQYLDWHPSEAPLSVPKQITLRFRKGMAIGGRIEDESGKPVAGAKVEIRMPATSGSDHFYFNLATVKSDSQGRWQCDGAPNDPSCLDISVEHADFIEGHAAGSVEMKGLKHCLRLQRGTTVAGQVLDAKGQPLKGASAILGLETLGDGGTKTTTDAHGRFELKRCAGGPSAVTVQAEGFAPQCQRIIVAQGKTPLSLRLEPAATIRGRVVDVHGKPLAKVNVYADTWQGLRNLGVQLTTDMDGRFVWKNAPRDSVLFHLCADGFMSNRNCPLIASDEERTITLYPELAIHGNVADEETGKPIDAFRIFRGYRWEGRQEMVFDQEEGVAGGGGHYEFRISEPSPRIYVKVEADGYKPAVSREFTPTDGAQTCDFKLKKGSGLSGTVLTPDGKPAGNARVILSAGEIRGYLNNGRWNANMAPSVQADSQGRFHFAPTEAANYSLIAVHESGIGKASREEAEKSSRITLQPWGRLEGTVRIGDHPARNEAVTFQLDERENRSRRERKAADYRDLVSTSYEVTTDDQGRFVMDRMIPGKGYAGRMVVVSFGQSSVNAPSHMTPVEILPGRTARVEIGGKGRPIVGRIDSGDRTVEWATCEPGNVRSTRDAWQSYAFGVARDGTFRIDDVVPGVYSLDLRITEPPDLAKCGPGALIGTARHEFTMPEVPGGRSDEPLDLRTLKATLKKLLRVGDMVPAAGVHTLDNQNFQFRQQKGKVVLAYFWATWCEPCRAELPELKRIYERFHGEPKFSMIGLSLDDNDKLLVEYVKKEAIRWPQARVKANDSPGGLAALTEAVRAFVAPSSSAGVLADFGVQNVPACFLIGPDGKVIGKDLHGKQLEDAVEKALASAADGRQTQNQPSSAVNGEAAIAKPDGQPVSAAAKGISPAPQPQGTAPAEPPPALPTAFGKIVDPAGKPVAGATVYLREWSTVLISREPYNQNLNDILATTQTDAAGAFRFEKVPAKPLHDQWLRQIPWDVVVVAKPFAMAWRHLDTAQQSKPWTISLTPEAKITGRVTDKQGRPVREAEVKVVSISSLAGESHPRSNDPETLGLAWSRLAPVAKTDADGRVTIAGLPRDLLLRAFVTHDDFRSEIVYAATTEQPQGDIDFPDYADGKESVQVKKVYSANFSAVLGPPLPRIVGRVTAADSKMPLAGIRVGPLGRLGTVTDQDGRFTIKEVRDSTCRLLVFAPQGGQYLGRLVHVAVAKERRDTQVDVELARGEILSGTVADERTGNGVAGVGVSFDTGFDINTASKDGSIPSYGQTDSGGRFRLAVPPGKGKVKISGDVRGYRLPGRAYRRPGEEDEDDPEFIKNVEVIAGKPTGEVKFTVRPVAVGKEEPMVRRDIPGTRTGRRTVEGVATDPSGKPVAGAKVGFSSWFNNDREQRRLVQSDQNGHFSFRTDSGSYQPSREVIVAMHKERKLHGHVPMPDTSQAGAAKMPLEIHLVPTGAVTGRVLEGDKPIVGVQVSLIESNPTAGSRSVTVQDVARTDEHGRFEFPAMEADMPFNLDLLTSGYAELSTARRWNLRVAAGRTLEIKPFLMIRTDKFVSGIVVDPDGNPIPKNTRLLLSREEAWDSPVALVATDGSFSFSGVPEEAVTLSTWIPGYRLSSQRNHFQQLRPGAVAMFVDADKSKLEVFFEPEAANQPSRTIAAVPVEDASKPKGKSPAEKPSPDQPKSGDVKTRREKLSMKSAADSPTATLAAGLSGRQFELQVVGPDDRPVPQAAVNYRIDPKPLYAPGAWAKTDADGRLVIPLPAKPCPFAISIEQPGFTPYFAPWGFFGAEPIPSQFTAKLDAAWTVGGVIVNADGAPIAGVKVSPMFEYKHRPGDLGQLLFGTDIITDADGRWSFASVPLAMKKVQVDIDHPDYAPDHHELARDAFGIEAGHGPKARITLQRGLTATGTVRDEAGHPVAGALLQTELYYDQRRRATTGPDGTYRLVGCEPGRKTRIVITAPGKAMDLRDVRIEPDMKPVDFVLKPGGKLRVRVLDDRGKPVAKTQIWFQSWRGDLCYFAFEGVNQYADEQGVWQWNEAPLDKLEADICPPGGMQLPHRPLVAREQEYVFRFVPELVISGNVTDAVTGKPVKRFRVVPGLRDGSANSPGLRWLMSRSFEAADGRYELQEHESLPAWRVRIEADGYEVATSREIHSDEGKVRIDFPLKPAPDITATVLTPAGAPAAGAQVALGFAGSRILIFRGRLNATWAAQCDADDAGRFHFPAQNADFQLVIAHPSGFAHWKSTAGPIPNTIRLTPWARAEGTFRIGRKAEPNVELRLSPITITSGGPDWHYGYAILSSGPDVPQIGASYDLTTGSNGHFQFDCLLPGEARIGRSFYPSSINGSTETTSSAMTPVRLVAGETLKLDLGGGGRPVTGKLASPADFQGKVRCAFAIVEVHVQVDMPQPKSPPITADVRDDPARNRAWWKQWNASDEGKAWQAACKAYDKLLAPYPSFTATVDAQGAFRIDDMPPGKYLLRVRPIDYAEEPPPGHLSAYRFSVPETKSAEPGQPIYLGVLTLEP